MRSLAARDILWVYEQGWGRPGALQALILLRAALPREPWAALCARTLGMRDSALLRLREATFGPHMPCRAACPACGETVAFTLSTPGLLADAPGEDEAAPATDGSGARELAHQGYRVRYRAITAGDLLEVAGSPPEATGDEAPAADTGAAAGQDGLEQSAADPAHFRATLLARCVLSAERAGSALEPRELPGEVLQAVEQALAGDDPLAETLLELGCPTCGHAWEEALDVPGYLWGEVDAEARRLLRDVDELARRYGWREEDILAMSALRRHFYLEGVGG